MKNEWCEHIEKIGDILCQPDGKPFLDKIFGMDVNFCPICGTPRPDNFRNISTKIGIPAIRRMVIR